MHKHPQSNNRKLKIKFSTRTVCTNQMAMFSREWKDLCQFAKRVKVGLVVTFNVLPLNEGNTNKHS